MWVVGRVGIVSVFRFLFDVCKRDAVETHTFRSVDDVQQESSIAQW